MRILSFRQATAIALLAASALVIPPALAVDYIISTPTIVTNGDAATVLDGSDTLSVTGTGSIATSAPGVYAIFSTVGLNTISNAGSIATTSVASYGIYAIGGQNTIANSGSLSTTGVVSFGIFTDIGLNNISNTGSVATAGDAAYGIYAVGGMDTISNSGSLTTAGDGAFAILAVGDQSTISNSGSLTTAGDGAFGILADGTLNNIANSGTLSTGGVGSVGIYIADNLNTIANTGAINTSSSAAPSIYIGGEGNSITNFGEINTSGASSPGIMIGGTENTINNTGIILTTGASSPGIWGDVDSSGTAVNNSGKIVGSQGVAFSFTDGGDNIFNLTAPSFIGGAMEFSNSDAVNITTGRSHSVLWDFSNDPNTPPTMSFAGPVPWAWDAATQKFATIDPTALSAAPDVLAGMTGSLSDLARANAQDGRWWLNGYGNFSGYGAQGIYNDYNALNGGIATGASFVLNDNFNLGVMAGYMAGALNVNSKWMSSQTIKSNGVVGGVYGNARVDNVFVDFAIFAGGQNNSSSRLVNDNLAPLGVDYANANYNSWFVSPELRVGVDVETGDAWTLTPSASARFSSQNISGYTETGSNANVTVGQRRVQVFEGDLELAATRTLENGSVTLKGGAQYRQSLGGGATQNVTLLGQTLAIPLNTAGTIIGYAGLDADFAIGDASTLNLSTRAAIGQNNFKSISALAGFSTKLP